MILIAILFPALSFLLRGKLVTAILAFVLQCTFIGWLPVAIWAAISYSNAKTNIRLKQMEQRRVTAHK
jgi:hypothetical protein